MPQLYNRHTGDAPPDAVYIGRGSPYGNPFEIGRDGTRAQVCRKYEEYVMNNPELLERIKTELKGRDLLCSCFPKKCHGDFLLRVANDPEDLDPFDDPPRKGEST